MMSNVPPMVEAILWITGEAGLQRATK
jgi:hypothetical protein